MKAVTENRFNYSSKEMGIGGIKYHFLKIKKTLFIENQLKE
jgi:hypothetical protein